MGSGPSSCCLVSSVESRFVGALRSWPVISVCHRGFTGSFTNDFLPRFMQFADSVPIRKPYNSPRPGAGGEQECAQGTQRGQDPLIKEYTLNHKNKAL